jgi:DNA/RNA endonuclease YhcR with UshA esterase domain
VIIDLAPCYADFSESVTFGLTTFRGILDTVDAMAFESPTNTTHQLRYQTGPALVAGSSISIAGVSYKVAGVPQRLNASERVAPLVRQP